MIEDGIEDRLLVLAPGIANDPFLLHVALQDRAGVQVLDQDLVGVAVAHDHEERVPAGPKGLHPHHLLLDQDQGLGNLTPRSQLRMTKKIKIQAGRKTSFVT